MSRTMAMLSGPQSWTKKLYDILNTIRESSYWPKICSVWNLNRWLKVRMHASDFIGNLFLIEDWTALTLRRSVKTAIIWHVFDEPNVDFSPAFVYRSTNRLPRITLFQQRNPPNTLCNAHHPSLNQCFLHDLRSPSSSTRDTAPSAHVGGLSHRRPFIID